MTATALRRQLGVADAVVIGVGSMVGAGVFSVWSSAADAAGATLLVGLAVAALVACANAMSSAQLAAVHPESGGTYVYARHRLGPAWGHLAGWCFVVGKTASCVAIALTAGAYLWPAQARPVAVAAVVVVTAVNVGGLTRTVRVTKVVLTMTGVSLVVAVVAGWTGGDVDLGRVGSFGVDPWEVLRAAGYLFFAFAGYARIATLGAEVRDPARTIPRAVPLALGAVLGIYAVVGTTTLVALPLDVLVATEEPVRALAEQAGTGAGRLVRIGAGVAAFGVLLNLVPGISRTVLAMANRGELPAWLGRVDARRALPLRAEVTVAAIVSALVTVVDLRAAIGFSSVTVLTYYAVTNAAALRLSDEERRWPPAIAVFGLVGCVALAVALPAAVGVTGVAVLASGVIVRGVTRRLRQPA